MGLLSVLADFARRPQPESWSFQVAAAVTDTGLRRHRGSSLRSVLGEPKFRGSGSHCTFDTSENTRSLLGL